VSRSIASRRIGALDGNRLIDLVVERITEDLAPGNLICQEFGFETLDDPAEAEGCDPRLPEHAEAFGAFVRAKAEEKLAEAVHQLGTEISVLADGRAELWRELVVPADWPSRGVRERPLGVCWAFHPDAAEAHWGGGGSGCVRVVLHGVVEPDCIDWQETAVLSAAAEHTVGEEREIRLLAHARVELRGLWLRDANGRLAEMDARGLCGRFFPAGDPTPECRDCGGHDDVHEAARAVTGYFGAAGAGGVVMARSTGRMLLPRRSEEVDEPGTYGTWGGALDPGLDPRTGALRELGQEAGYWGSCEMEALKPYEDAVSGFVFHNFLVVVDEEFDPVLNEETERADWTDLDALPDPLHFGLQALLDDPDSLRRLREVADAVAAPTP
jgi:hypothetical protein